MSTLGRLESEPRVGGAARGQAERRNARRGRLVGALLCALPGVYFAATALYGCLHGADYASATPQLLRYVVGPALISMVFFGCALALPGPTKLAVGLNGAALLVALFAFELFMLSRTIPIYFGNLGQLDAARGAASGVLPGYGLKGLNRMIGTTRLPDAMLGGLPGQETLLCARNGVPISFVADRFGFNNPDQVYDGDIDVLVLGDSFIEGVCLERGRDVVGRLRELRPGSLGVATRGNGPLLELAALHRYGRDLRPRHIVIAFFEGNDWRNLGLELETPWLRAALDDGAEFGEPPAPAAAIAKTREASERRARREVTLRDLVVRTRLLRNTAALNSAAAALGLAYPRAPKDHPEFLDALVKAKRFAQQKGARLHLLYIPQVDRFLGLLPHGFVMDQLRAKVLAAADRAGVEAIDLTPMFRDSGAAARFYQPDGHFSEHGARFAAQVIAARVGDGRTAAR
jgi:hypothetical protein